MENASAARSFNLSRRGSETRTGAMQRNKMRTTRRNAPRAQRSHSYSKTRGRQLIIARRARSTSGVGRRGVYRRTPASGHLAAGPTARKLSPPAQTGAHSIRNGEVPRLAIQTKDTKMPSCESHLMSVSPSLYPTEPRFCVATQLVRSTPSNNSSTYHLIQEEPKCAKMTRARHGKQSPLP